MSDSDALDELRLIFRGEVEDHVATLEREASRVARAADDAAARTAAREIYRAVHTLKGAARAVELPSIERTCHALETRLASAETDPSLAARLGARLAEALRDWLHTGTESALVRVESFDGAAPPEARELASAAPDPRTADGPAPLRAELAPTTASTPKETTRVAVARLGELAEGAEELLGLSSRQVHDSKSVDDTLRALRNDLARVRDAARRTGNTETVGAVERAVSTAHTLKLLLANDRERVDVWRRSIALASREVAGRARALRVVPLSTLASGLERATHDLATALGKSVELELDLERAEVDRTVRDALREVLLHLVRNAVDHGVEPEAAREAAGKPRAGRIRVVTEVAGRELRVVVEDDGAGLDPERVLGAARRLGRRTDGLNRAELLGMIFEPGLSTSTTTTEVSGRGMGLDIVRQRVGELHGRVEVESRVPSGTRFRLVLPVDLSVMRGLVVHVADLLVVVPSTAILRLRRLLPEAIRSIEGRAYVDEGGTLLPLVQLGAVFGRERAAGPRAPSDVVCCVVVGAGDRSMALEVDAFQDERELVVRKPSSRLRRVPFLAGVSVLDAGDVAIVLDAHDLVHLGRARPVATTAEAERRVRALVVDDSITTRQLVRSILETAGYDVRIAPDGEQAWNVLREADMDVVVSDVDMPRVDGFQLLARIRADRRLAQLPVILVTALENDVDRQRAVDLGASAYIVKAGFDQDALLSAIEERT